MGSSVSLLSHDVTTLITQDGVLDAHAVLFSYEPANPYEVAIALPLSDTKAEWVFSRDLLRDGLTTVAGQGDVVLYPDSGAVVVELHSQGAAIRLECAQRGIQRFVREMFTAVPEGAESVVDDVDIWIAGLLANC